MMFFKSTSRNKPISPRQAERLLLEHFAPVLPQVLEGFYAWITDTPELKKLVESVRGERTVQQVVEHLTAAQTDHWTKRLEDGDGPAYLARSTAIGQTHMRIGLNLEFFIEGYRYILTQGTLHLASGFKGTQAEQTAMLVALQKLVIDDLNNIARAYHAALAEKAQQDMAQVGEQLREQMGAAVSTIAGSTTELSGRADDISSQLEEGGRRIDKAATQADEARRVASNLSQLTSKIDDVAEFIDSISVKINLVALNASIEAARAGDAGRGFGVVADEVKKLAATTSKATEEVREQVEKIRAGVQVATEAIGGLSSTVSNMQELTHAVATTMREQATASSNISKNATELATGVDVFLEELTRIRETAPH